jgi:hypothetical protein
VPEEEKEVVDEDPQDHGRLYGVEPLHREAAGKIFFQLFDGVLIVCPGLAQRPYFIGWFFRIGDPCAKAIAPDDYLVRKERHCFSHRLLDHRRKADPLKECCDKRKPPYAVIFLLVKAILTLFTRGIVVAFFCIVSFLLLHGVGCLETIDSIAKGGLLLRVK